MQLSVLIYLTFFITCCSVLLNPIVGAAHHAAFMRPYGLFDVVGVSLANSMSLFSFLDDISDKMDFIGINYYGQVLSALNLFPVHLGMFAI